MSILQYSTFGSYFESATPKKIDLRFDLITFLGVAQKNEIEFLPITWQPALDHIGLGATAEIREASMSLQMSFAFKRPIFTSSFNLEELEKRVLPALIAEISVLSHPAVRNHPNVIHLEGVCWEIVSSEGENVSRKGPIFKRKGGIVPVFVFEKAKHGDLHKFMAHTERKLGFVERIKMCADIAKAIAEMHSHSMFPTMGS